MSVGRCHRSRIRSSRSTPSLEARWGRQPKCHDSSRATASAACATITGMSSVPVNSLVAALTVCSCPLRHLDPMASTAVDLSRRPPHRLATDTPPCCALSAGEEEDGRGRRSGRFGFGFSVPLKTKNQVVCSHPLQPRN